MTLEPFVRVSSHYMINTHIQARTDRLAYQKQKHFVIIISKTGSQKIGKVLKD